MAWGLPYQRSVVGRVAQAKVRAEVDNALSQAGEVLDAAHGATVGQPQEEQIAGLQVRGADKLELGRPAQIGVGEVDVGAGITFARYLGDFNLRMLEQEAQQFTAHVAGRAHNRSTNLLRHRSVPTGQRNGLIIGRAILPAIGRGPAFLGHTQRKIDHACRNVDARRQNAVAVLHGVIHFVDQQPARRIFEHVDGDDAAAHRPGRATQRSFNSGVTGQLLDLPPRAVLVIQCGESR